MSIDPRGTPPSPTPPPAPCDRVHVPEAVLYIAVVVVAAATGALVATRLLAL